MWGMVCGVREGWEEEEKLYRVHVVGLMPV